MSSSHNGLGEKARYIRMFAMDCDGVLTDGGMYYSELGDELKKFNTKDGMGISLLHQMGIITAIITGENSRLVARRAEKLGVKHCFLGVKDKVSILAGLVSEYRFKYHEVAYIGDDINDMEVLKQVGLALSVSDGMECVKSLAHYVTKAGGGCGAVREAAELILQYKGSH